MSPLLGATDYRSLLYEMMATFPYPISELGYVHIMVDIEPMALQNRKHEPEQFQRNETDIEAPVQRPLSFNDLPQKMRRFRCMDCRMFPSRPIVDSLA
jgi:hypothetical protein